MESDTLSLLTSPEGVVDIELSLGIVPDVDVPGRASDKELLAQTNVETGDGLLVEG